MPRNNSKHRGAIALLRNPTTQPFHHQPERGRRPKPAVHKELEVILMRHLADCLAMPIFLVNAEGTLLFYNEPAEVLLGQRFEETGELTTDQWATAFVPTDHQTCPMPPEKIPLVIALREKRPCYADFRIRGLDQIERNIQACAFPLVGRTGRFVGAVAIFWEAPRP